MKNLNKFLSVILITAFIFLLSSCSAKDITGKTINYPLSSDPIQLDPQISSSYSSKLVLQNIFEGLTRINKNNQVEPGVAAKWDVSPDKLTYTFYLRRDSYWVDHEAVVYDSVRAKDFVFGITRALNPDTKSPLVNELYCIKNALSYSKGEINSSELGIKAPDDYTLIITLENPCDLPRLVSNSTWFPCNRTFFDSCGGGYGLEPETLLYNGPFRIRIWDHDKFIRLNYISQYKGYTVPSPASIILDMEITPETLIDSLNNRFIDASSINYNQFESLTPDSFQKQEFLDTTWALCFNSNDSFFNASIARQAFTQSIDRSLIDSHIPDGFSFAHTLIPPASSINGKPFRETDFDENLPTFDTETAKANLFYIIDQKEIDTLHKIDLICPDDDSIKKALSFLLKAWQENLGVYINLVPLPLDDLKDKVAESDYSIAFVPVRADDESPISALAMFVSDSPANFIAYESELYDDIVNELISAPASIQNENINTAEKMLLEDSLTYPLFYEKRLFVYHNKISDIIYKPFDAGVDFITTGKEDD